MPEEAPVKAEETRRAAEAVRRMVRGMPEIALVLGSGLGEIAALVQNREVVRGQDIPGYPTTTAAGHRGQLVFGDLEGRRVVFLEGRAHLYEGTSLQAVTFPIRLVHALGARRLVVTCAAGGINPLFTPGTVMLLADHMPSPPAPLWGGKRRSGAWESPYDAAWLDRTEAAAQRIGIAARRGVYLWTLGPSYETKAEIRFFGRIGADAVGMSTVPEVIQARTLGLPVLGLSLITNLAAGRAPSPLSHQDVLGVGRRMRHALGRLIAAVIQEA